MNTLKQFLLPVLESFEFAWQVIHYALIFVSAFFRQRTSLACEMVAIRSQLTSYEESIRQKEIPGILDICAIWAERSSCQEIARAREPMTDKLTGKVSWKPGTHSIRQASESHGTAHLEHTLAAQNTWTKRRQNRPSAKTKRASRSPRAARDVSM